MCGALIRTVKKLLNLRGLLAQLLACSLCLAGFATHAQATATSVTITSSPNPTVVGQTTTLTITVAPPGASGNVYLTSGDYSWGAPQLVNGQTSVTISLPTSGSQAITAHYLGSGAYAASTSAPYTQTVTPGTPTSTLLTSSINPSLVAQATTLTATVSPALSGTIVFKSGTSVLGSVPLTNGKATLVTSFATSGLRTVTARYGGSAGYEVSTSAPVTQTVNAATTSTVATSTTLSSSVNPSTTGQATLLTASVSPAAASGSVTFKDGAAILGTALLSSGKATLSARFASAGTRSLSAVYAGTTGYAPSTSSPLSQIVNTPAPPTITLPAAPVSPPIVIKYHYDAQGNRTQTIVAPDVAGLALTTTTGYDALNRPIAITNPAQGTTQLAYDSANQVIRVTDPKGLVTLTPRDGLGQALQLQSPDTGTATHSFDVSGNLSSRTDSRGVSAAYSYDLLNRPTRAVYSQSGQASRTYDWVYDQTDTGNNFSIGQLTTARFPEGSTRFAHDIYGNVIQVTQTINPTPGGNTAILVHRTSYGYTSDNLTSITYPLGAAGAHHLRPRPAHQREPGGYGGGSICHAADDGH
jgi:YD repeat-containing protein